MCASSEAHVGIESATSNHDFKLVDTGKITVGTPPGAVAHALNGTVKFKLYKGNCEGTVIYEAEVKVVNGEARTESPKFLSELIGSTETAGTYNWQISYGGDTDGNKPFTAKCGAERFTITNG